MKTAEQIADAVIEKHYGTGTDYAEPNEHGESGLTLALVEDDTDGDWIREHIIEAIEADRAQRFTIPEVLGGAIHPTEGGVFVNDRGDFLVEPIGDEELNLIYVRADGSTMTGTGEWSTGWEA